MRTPSRSIEPSPQGASLLLLMKVNATQTWRRLLGVREQSKLLTGIILLFIGGYLTLSFWLFHYGLKFVAQFPGLGALLTERLLFLLFAFLFGLLLLSNLVIGYSNFFRNKETQFLNSLPVSANTLFQWKFLESALLASWAFLFLVAPLLAAFGITREVSWAFYPATLLLLSLFIVLPALLGMTLVLWIAKHLDRRAFQVILLTAALIGLASLALWFRPEKAPEESQETRVLAVLDQILNKTRFAQFPFLPSFWLSSAVLHLSDKLYYSAGFFALVLLSYVLFFGGAAMTRLGNQFMETTSIVWSRESVLGRWDWFRRRRKQKEGRSLKQPWIETTLRKLPFSPDVLALLLKDGRVFWRDTTQWGQIAMLFGLLGVYILNLRHFGQQLSNPFWVHLVSYLNLGACSLNLATITTRFVYPQFSLEGKRLWIVGMAPLGLPDVVRIKYWSASGLSILITTALILMSCTMLEMTWDRKFYFVVTMIVMTLTLNSVAIALGVLYPNFKEENPSKIVSGFGGTFCLVLSFLYILLSVVVLAVASPWRPFRPPSDLEVSLGWVGFLSLSLLLAAVPFRLALRRLKTLEI